MQNDHKLQVVAGLVGMHGLGMSTHVLINEGKGDLLYIHCEAKSELLLDKCSLLTRYKTLPAGYWVIMKSVISSVDIFILVYAYSNKYVAYFVSTCGTMQHSINYKSCYGDGYGNIQIITLTCIRSLCL